MQPQVTKAGRGRGCNKGRGFSRDKGSRGRFSFLKGLQQRQGNGLPQRQGAQQRQGQQRPFFFFEGAATEAGEGAATKARGPAEARAAEAVFLF